MTKQNDKTTSNGQQTLPDRIEIGIFWFFATHVALKSTSKDWLNRKKDNVFYWWDRSTSGTPRVALTRIVSEWGIAVQHSVNNLLAVLWRLHSDEMMTMHALY
jgi:hypothetical protein